MVGLALAGGCGPDSAPDVDDSAISPTPWDYSEEPGTPSRTAAEIEALLPEALVTLRAVDPGLLFDVYDQLVDAGDERCPDVHPAAHRFGWGGACTARTGWSYDGRAESLHLVETEEVHGHGDMDIFATITGPDGAVMVSNGSSVWTEATADGERGFDGYVVGTFAWSGASGAGTWLAGGTSATLWIKSGDDGAGARWLWLDGGVSTADAGLAVAAEGLRLNSAATGADCPTEPAGALRLRFTDGEVYRVAFDGAAEPTQPAADCDGCGTVTFNDEALGTACLDASPLLDWEGRPW